MTLPFPISVQGMFHENVTCYIDLHDDCDRRRLDTITTMNATQHLELQKKKLEGLKQIRLRLAQGGALGEDEVRRVDGDVGEGPGGAPVRVPRRGRAEGVLACDKNNTELGRPTISSEPHISLKTRSFRLILGPVIISARDLKVRPILFLRSVHHRPC